MKSKEKEKDTITDRLKKMTDEEAQVEREMKKLKLGVWGKGLEKGLVSYVKDNYDEERNTEEMMMRYEKKLMMKNSNVNDLNQNVLINDLIDEERENNEIEIDNNEVITTLIGEDEDDDSYNNDDNDENNWDMDND
jgi:hypothetical protein